MAYLHAFGVDFWIAAICNLRNSLAHTGICSGCYCKEHNGKNIKQAMPQVIDKIGVTDEETGSSVEFLGKLVFLIVFLLFLPGVLDKLGMQMYLHRSHPWYPVLGFIPNLSQPLVILVQVYLSQGW